MFVSFLSDESLIKVSTVLTPHWSVVEVYIGASRCSQSVKQKSPLEKPFKFCICRSVFVLLILMGEMLPKNTPSTLAELKGMRSALICAN